MSACADCSTALAPTGKRGRPAHRCKACILKAARKPPIRCKGCGHFVARSGKRGRPAQVCAKCVAKLAKSK